MKPVKTKDSNTRLIHPEEEHLPDDQRGGDLYAERLYLVAEDGQQRPGYESVWLPDDKERKALVNGAPITLRLWGSAHPPVNMHVGDVPEPEGGDPSLQALVTVKETREAAGKFFARLSTRMEESTEIGAEEIPAMFNLALEEVLRARPQRPSSNGNGKG